MNVIGIIAEYNPFHWGHAYQIESLKQKLHADYVIIAMSGNFVQRGAPALIDKYTRTRMALSCGADLVLELPVLFATASAQYFARGGVSLLHHTGIVTHLGFGTENDNLPMLTKIADLLLRNPHSFQAHLQRELKVGSSFPLARKKALEEALSLDSTIDPLELQALLASPNNILAIEYIKALLERSSPIKPVPILRKGSGYHDTHMTDKFCSASAIRNYLKEQKENDSLPVNAMPWSAQKLLADHPHPILFEDDFSQLLHFKLLTKTPQQLAEYADCTPELANRMHRNRYSFESFSQFCQLLKTKNNTYTRISRVLIHLLLDIRDCDCSLLSASSPTPYLRVLGFRKASAPLLSSIKNCGAAPIMTNPAHISELSSPESIQCLAVDTRASDLYHLALTAKGARGLTNDYRHPMIVL